MSGKVTFGAGIEVKEAEVRAVVTRCGCGDPLRLHERVNGQLQPCPTPRAVEDRGRISYYHRNPLRRWLWAMKNAYREGRQ